MSSARSIYSTQPKLVAVILSPRDLLAASRLRASPHFFELRLDALAPVLDQVESAVASLRAPLIVTARHPREGGLNNLDAARRGALLNRFLNGAAYIDIELRAVRELGSVRRQARRKKIGLIISFHDFKTTPSLTNLRAKARAARTAGADIFKIATRTDTRDELAQLLEFFNEPGVDVPLSAMGIGKLGRTARVELAHRGSVLVYGSIGRSRVEGQLSIAQLRSTLAALKVDAGTGTK